jgi:hypothetical protein
LGCLPLWGREGVTLIISDKYDRIAGEKIGFLQSQNIIINALSPYPAW